MDLPVDHSHQQIQKIYNMKAKIQPWIYNDKTAVNIEVPTIIILAGQAARINVILTDENSLPVYADSMVMPKTDYDQWGTDDSCIFNFCAGRFNPPVTVTEISSEPSKINLSGPAPRPGPTR